MRDPAINRIFCTITMLCGLSAWVPTACGGTGLPAGLARPPGVSPNTRLAIVWLDRRTSGPPDYSARAIPVPAYNPKVPYDPNNPNTSPLFPPPVKGGHAYLGDRPYAGVDFSKLGPPLAPADIDGYGRAFNLPAQLPPTAGDAPAILLNTATEARPPDLQAIAASHGQPSDTAEDNPAVLASVKWLGSAGPLPVATTMPSQPAPVRAGVAIAAPKEVPQTQPVSKADAGDNVRTRLASAFRLEDERHSRANLPVPIPAR